jgi:hypothetical protein
MGDTNSVMRGWLASLFRREPEQAPQSPFLPSRVKTGLPNPARLHLYGSGRRAAARRAICRVAVDVMSATCGSWESSRVEEPGDASGLVRSQIDARTRPGRAEREEPIEHLAVILIPGRERTPDVRGVR